MILYESGAISYYIDAKFGPQKTTDLVATRWLDWELSLADAFARLSRQYVDSAIVRSLYARPHFVQSLPDGPFAHKWTRIFDGTFCGGLEAEACLERNPVRRARQVRTAATAQVQQAHALVCRLSREQPRRHS